MNKRRAENPDNSPSGRPREGCTQEVLNKWVSSNYTNRRRESRWDSVCAKIQVCLPGTQAGPPGVASADKAWPACCFALDRGGL